MRNLTILFLLLLLTLSGIAPPAAAKQSRPPYGSTYAGFAETTFTHCPRVEDVSVTLAADGHLKEVRGFKSIGQEAWFGRIMRTRDGVSLQAYGYSEFDPDPHTPGATLTLGFEGERATGYLSFPGPLRLRCRFVIDLHLQSAAESAAK